MKHLLIGLVVLAFTSPALASAASTSDDFAEKFAAEVPGMPPGVDPARVEMPPNSTATHPLLLESGDAILLSNGGLSTKFLIGVSVTNQQGNPIGTLDDLVFSDDGRAKFALLSVGGFVGIDAKEVLVPFRAFSIGDESRSHPVVRTGMALDRLKSLPEFNVGQLAAGEVLASDLLGEAVKPENAGGQPVKLTDIIIDQRGVGRYAAVEYGGIDGIGAKRTVVEFSTLGKLAEGKAIPLDLKMAVLRKAQPFIYKSSESKVSIPSIFGS